MYDRSRLRDYDHIRFYFPIKSYFNASPIKLLFVAHIFRRYAA